MRGGKQNGPEAGGGGRALPAGTHLEEFVIKRVLGAGGFGITYLAEDTSLGREVVIKENLPVQFAWREPATGTVRGDVEDFKWSLRNFLKEAETLASLNHSGIVKVLRKFEANGTAYFVMPFVEGVTLDALIERRKAKNQPFSEEEIRKFLHYMLVSLGYLHERGIYHRDIKPGNVLVTMDGEPILIDFGSARQRLCEHSMTVIESPGYTPFEQLESRGNVGPWSDLYALGATLVKAIAFETPPKANDRMMGDPWKGLASNPEWMSLYSAGTLESIDQSMAVVPADRWQSAENWSAALSDPQSKCSPIGALPPPQKSATKKSAKKKTKLPKGQKKDANADTGAPAQGENISKPSDNKKHPIPAHLPEEPPNGDNKPMVPGDSAQAFKKKDPATLSSKPQPKKTNAGKKKSGIPSGAFAKVPADSVQKTKQAKVPQKVKRPSVDVQKTPTVPTKTKVEPLRKGPRKPRKSAVIKGSFSGGAFASKPKNSAAPSVKKEEVTKKPPAKKKAVKKVDPAAKAITEKKGPITKPSIKKKPAKRVQSKGLGSVWGTDKKD